VIIGIDGVTIVPETVFIGNSNFSNHLTVRAILQASGTHCVRISPDVSPTATTYMFRIRLVRAGTAEVEANGTFGTANATPGGGIVSGVINPAADLDFYSFSATAGEVVIFRLVGGTPGATIAVNYSTHGSAVQGLLTVFDTDGTTVITTASRNVTRRAQGLIFIDQSVEVAFVAPSTGTFFISVADATGAGGVTRFYVLDRD
jgi:hypothetical protein